MMIAGGGKERGHQATTSITCVNIHLDFFFE